jgi:hypothetical protein
MNATFKIKIARTFEQQNRAISIRERAYAKHVPTLAEVLGKNDSVDIGEDTVHIYCEDAQGQVVGSLRFTGNRRKQLPIERGFELPTEMSGANIGEVTRLAVPPNTQAKYIKSLLFKSAFLYSISVQVRWILVGARFPLDLQYLKLGFKELFPDMGYVPLEHIAGIPHRVLVCEVSTLESRWRLNQHNSYCFLFETFHPEIKIFDALSSEFSNPRVPTNNANPFVMGNLSDRKAPSSSN